MNQLPRFRNVLAVTPTEEAATSCVCDGARGLVVHPLGRPASLAVRDLDTLEVVRTIPSSGTQSTLCFNLGLSLLIELKHSGLLRVYAWPSGELANTFTVSPSSAPMGTCKFVSISAREILVWNDSTSIARVDVLSGQTIVVMEVPEHPSDVRLSPDGVYAMAVGLRGSALIDLRSGEVQQHKTMISSSVAWLDDTHIVLSSDGLVEITVPGMEQGRVWGKGLQFLVFISLSTGRLLIEGEKQPLSLLDWNSGTVEVISQTSWPRTFGPCISVWVPERNLVVRESDAGGIEVWKTSDLQESNERGNVIGLCVMDDDSILSLHDAFGFHGRLWKTSPDGSTQQLLLPGFSPSGLVGLPGRRQAMVRRHFEAVALIDSSGTVLAEAQGGMELGVFHAGAYRVDLRDCLADLWIPPTLDFETILKDGNIHACRFVDVSESGRTLCCITHEESLVVWDRAHERLIWEMPWSITGIGGSVDDDGTVLLTGTKLGNRLEAWRDGVKLWSHESMFTGRSWQRRGYKMAVVVRAKLETRLCELDVRTGTVVRECIVPQVLGSWNYLLVWSPDDRWIALKCLGFVFILDVETWTIRQTWETRNTLTAMDAARDAVIVGDTVGNVVRIPVVV